MFQNHYVDFKSWQEQEYILIKWLMDESYTFEWHDFYILCGRDFNYNIFFTK